MIDVYASVEGRDLGGVASDIQKVLANFRTSFRAARRSIAAGKSAP